MSEAPLHVAVRASRRYVRWGRKDRNAWHVSEEQGETICGRWPGADPEWRADLPAARSCESCLRIARRRTDSW